MWCAFDVMWCDVMRCDVMWCDVRPVSPVYPVSPVRLAHLRVDFRVMYLFCLRRYGSHLDRMVISDPSPINNCTTKETWFPEDRYLDLSNLIFHQYIVIILSRSHGFQRTGRSFSSNITIPVFRCYEQVEFEKNGSIVFPETGKVWNQKFLLVTKRYELYSLTSAGVRLWRVLYDASQRPHQGKICGDLWLLK